MSLKKIAFMDTSFRDGFQSVYGARVITEDFLPAVVPRLKPALRTTNRVGARDFKVYFSIAMKARSI
jgi:pyruvate carboxylase subunit B